MKVLSQRMKAIRWTICLVLLFSALSCFAPQIYASTDCDRWIAEYKQGLLQKRTVQHLAAVKHRVQHKLVGYHPHRLVHPTLRRAAYPRRLGPLTRLKHFLIECGVLPPDKPELVDVATVPVPGLLPPVPLGPLDETALFSPSPPPVASLTLPPSNLGFPPTASSSFPPVGGGGGFAPPGQPSRPGTPGGPLVPGAPSAPGVPSAPGTPSSPGSPSAPGAPPVGSPIPGSPTPLPPGLPGGPPVDSPAPSPVPEPGSFVLVITGAAAAVAGVRRRARVARKSTDNQ